MLPQVCMQTCRTIVQRCNPLRSVVSVLISVTRCILTTTRMSYALGDSRERLREASLILTGPYDGRPYNRSDFLQGIKEHKAKCKYLAVYWIGLRLRNHVASFTSLSIPHADHVPEYYKIAMNAFNKLSTLGARLYGPPISYYKVHLYKIIRLKTNTTQSY